MGIRIYLDIKHRERFENHKATLTGFFVGKCSISPLSAHFSQYPAFGIVHSAMPAKLLHIIFMLQKPQRFIFLAFKVLATYI